MRKQSWAMQAPYDILSAIFEESVGSSGDAAPSVPFLLASVCKHWRRVILSTPAAWASLRLKLDAGQNNTDWGYVQDWLDRSRQRPLSISITTSSGIASPSWAPLLVIVNGSSRRWREITFHLPSTILSLLGGAQQQTPILRYVDLRCTDAIPQSTVQIVPAQPQKVIISFLPLYLVHIDWTNLVDAEMLGLPVNQCLELLNQAPQLRRFKLLDVHEPDQLTPAHLIHLALHDLEFTTYHGSGNGDLFFNALTLPRLERLYFCAQHPGSLPDESLRFLVERSSCPLRELRFYAVEAVSEDNFFQLLNLVPSLQHLEYDMDPCSHDYISPSQLIRRLIDTSYIKVTQPFLPQFAHFGCLSREPIPWNEVLDLFGPTDELGHPDRRPLNTVRINFSLVFSNCAPGVDYFTRDEIQRIALLQAAGRNLIIHCHPDDHSTLSTADLLQKSVERQQEFCQNGNSIQTPH